MADTARVEAFSDGVFAIAITLLVLVLVLVLVLEIQIEPAGVADLWHALAEEWPPYLASVTSFRTVGGVWRGDAALRGHRVPAVAARAVYPPGRRGRGDAAAPHHPAG